MDELVSMVLEETEESMKKALDHLEHELQNIRAGKANPTMLKGIKIEYYGTPTPLDQMANITVLDPYTLAVKPWEKQLIKNVEQAIIAANLGFNPQSDAEMVRIPIPRLTEERRKKLARQAKGEGENAKIVIRGIRRNANSDLKKLKEDDVSEDEIKLGETKVQETTNKFTTKVDEILKKKEEEIMTV